MDEYSTWNCSIKPAILGFFFSLILIYSSYRLDQMHVSSSFVLTCTLLFLCVLQALIQFFFFLHVGLEQNPKWNLYAFLFTTFIVLLVVSGTIWILQNLDYNLMRSN